MIEFAFENQENISLNVFILYIDSNSLPYDKILDMYVQTESSCRKTRTEKIS